MKVFLSAEPKHWCHQPQLEDVAPELNWTQRVHLGSPLEREDGDYRLYSRCSMYNVSWPDVLQVIFVRVGYLSLVYSVQENGGEWPEHPDTNWSVVPCQHGWQYDTSEFVSTLVTELDLVCDQQWWPSTSTALFYVGSLVGNIVFGQIADRLVSPATS